MTDSRSPVSHLRLGPEFVSRLHEVIADAKDGDPLGRVTVITPSHYSSFFLRRAMAGYGLFNVDFVRIEDLAELLAEERLLSGGGRSLTHLRADELVFAAAKEVELTGPLAAVADQPSFHSALHRTLSDLESERQAAGPDDERNRISTASLGTLGRVARDVAVVWQAYRKAKRDHQFYDRTEVARYASNAVRAGALSSDHARLEYGALVLLVVSAASPQYRELWRALINTPGAHIVAGMTGDRDSDRAIYRSVSLEAPVPDNAAQTPPPPARLVSAADSRSEVTAVVREIFSAAERGVPFNRMAVLYGNASYAARIDDALLLAGAPVSGPDTTSLSSLPVGRFITGILDIANSGFSREKVGHWLTAAPVKDGETGKPVPGSRWDGIGRSAGITRGASQWSQRLEKFISSQDRRAQDVESNGETDGDSDLRAAALKRQVSDAKDLRRFIEQLAADLEHESQATWETHRDWLGNLLGKYLHAPEGSETRSALEKINLVLDGIAELDSLGISQPSFERFEQVVREELGRKHGGRRTLGRGVFVGPVSAAAGCSFEVVHIVGMADGSFPAPDRSDPLLPDDIRDRLNFKHNTQLPLMADRTLARRAEFHAALRSGRQAVLYWPRSSSTASRETGPSQWLVDEARRRPANETVQAGDLLSQPECIEGLTIAVPSIDEAVADAHEYDLLDVQAWLRLDRADAAKHFLELDAATGIAAALELENGRYGNRWSRWAGDLSHERAAFALMSGGVTSASRVQRYAVCPLRYFFNDVLSIVPTDKPEETVYLPADRRGTFVHRVLERYLSLRIKKESPTDEAILEEAFAFEREKWQKEELTGKDAAWRIEAEDLLRRLRRWLAAERKWEEAGFSPQDAEKAFGRDKATSAQISLSESSSLSFSGFIDRIDQDRGSSTVYVFDYKTGSSYGYNKLKEDPVDAGRKLQLAVYAEAVRQMYPKAQEVRAAYWFVLDPKPRILPEEFDSATATARLKDVVDVVNDSISSGHFPPNPGSGGDNCTHCDFQRACPAGIRRQRMFDVHTSDPRLRAYFGMADGAAQDGDA